MASPMTPERLAEIRRALEHNAQATATGEVDSGADVHLLAVELWQEVERVREAVRVDRLSLSGLRAMVTNWLTVDEVTLVPASRTAHLVLMLIDAMEDAMGIDNRDAQQTLYEALRVPMAERLRAATLRLQWQRDGRMGIPDDDGAPRTALQELGVEVRAATEAEQRDGLDAYYAKHGERLRSEATELHERAAWMRRTGAELAGLGLPFAPPSDFEPLDAHRRIADALDLVLADELAAFKAYPGFPRTFTPDGWYRRFATWMFDSHERNQRAPARESAGAVVTHVGGGPSTPRGFVAIGDEVGRFVAIGDWMLSPERPFDNVPDLMGRSGGDPFAPTEAQVAELYERMKKAGEGD